jgi:hypothetical protein
MGARDRAYFELTTKGSEELALRTYRLDAKIRNILFLIQKGYPTIEGILENSIFPREEVVDRLRELLRAHFITLHGDKPGAAPSTIMTPPPDTRSSGPHAPEPESEPVVQNSTFYFGGL